MREIFTKIYTYYGLGLFAILLLLALPFYTLIKVLVPYRQQIEWVYALNKAVMLIWFPLTGFRLKVLDSVHAQQRENYIVVTNHQNLIDMLALARGLSVAGKPLVKTELLHIPLLGWIFRMAALSVTRENKESRSSSYKKMIEELKMGISILIFPEGSRNRTDQPLTEFKDGAFRMSVESNVAILPVLVYNIRTKGGEKPIFLKPAKVVLHYLEPVFPEDFDHDVARIKAHCHNMMRTTLIRFDTSIKTI